MKDSWRDSLESDAANPTIQKWVAAEGSETEKRSLAMASNITIDASLLLLETGPVGILRTLCRNRAVAPEVLASAYAQYPELRADIESNPAAPVHVKLSVPVAELSGAALHRFLQAVEASAAERDALFAWHAKRDKQLKLRDAWDVVRSLSPGQVPIVDQGDGGVADG